MRKELKITFIILLKIYNDIVNFEQDNNIKYSNIHNRQLLVDLNKLLSLKGHDFNSSVLYASGKIQKTNQSKQNSMKLINQFQSLKDQIRQKNQQAQQKLQNSFKQETDFLSQANQQINSIKCYSQINQIIDQMIQQLKAIIHNTNENLRV